MQIRIAMGVAFGLAGGVCADEILVPGDQPTIQAGIDAAVNGDEVVVAPGVYEEIIDFAGKAIAVRSSGGADVTVIDATNVAATGQGKPVVRMDNGEGADTVLDGFTITGGDGDFSRLGVSAGGGIFCDGDVSARILNCIITGNNAQIGGGLCSNEASPEVVDCAFVGNESLEGGGGGAFCFEAGAATFTRCRFEGNIAASGGGGVAMFQTLASFSECDFIGNATTDSGFDGGGLFALSGDGDLTIDRCRFFANTSEDAGGGLSIGAQGLPVAMTNCVVGGNVALGDGGGMELEAGEFVISNCNVVGNLAAGNGGGVKVNSAANRSFVNGILRGNVDQSGSGGTAQYFSVGNVLATFCITQGIVAGEGNLDADPLFVDGPGADGVLGTEDDDLRLLAGSPAIDSGDTVFGGPYLGAFDIGGVLRLVDDGSTVDSGTDVAGLVVDRGAHEFGGTVPSLIEEQPESLIVEVGLAAGFVVGAPGASEFQWFHNGVALSDGPAYNGATNAVLFVNVLDASVEGLYSVEVGDGEYTETSASAGLVILANSCAADFNEDGFVNTGDVLDFLNAYTAGCP